MTLRDKQLAFISEYLKDFNATQAAIRAGYSARTAYSIGSENLSKPEISNEIKRQISEKIMCNDEVSTRLADIARGDIADLMSISSTGYNFCLLLEDDSGNKFVNPKTKLIKKIKQKVTTIIGKSESSDDREIVETEIELYNAQSALEYIAKLNGMITDKTELSGPGGGTIPVEVFQQQLEKYYGAKNE